MSVFLLLATWFAVCAGLLCWVRAPGVPEPPECSRNQTFEDADDETLVLMLERAWPTAISVTAFMATLQCAFGGLLPELATPYAYASAPRFTLDSAVHTNRLPSHQIVLGRLRHIEHVLLGRALFPGWRVGVVPLLYVEKTMPDSVSWRPLARTCTVERARFGRRHATLCILATGAVPSEAFQTSIAHMDCDWFVTYYGTDERHSLPTARLRFLFHMPRSLKSDLLIAAAPVASEYETVVFLDEDIVVRFNSTVWKAELMCAFGHIPVVWRPTFRPYSKTVWEWMNADCFPQRVRAVALGNFTFIEPQIFFVRSDFFVHYVDQYVVPVFGRHPTVRGIWTLIMMACVMAQRAFPDAVPCAMTTQLTVVHADLRTLPKDQMHFDNSYQAAYNGISRLPETHHELHRIDMVERNGACAESVLVTPGRFGAWVPPTRSQSEIRRVFSERVRERMSLPQRLCTAD